MLLFFVCRIRVDNTHYFNAKCKFITLFYGLRICQECRFWKMLDHVMCLDVGIVYETYLACYPFIGILGILDSESLNMPILHRNFTQSSLEKIRENAQIHTHILSKVQYICGVCFSAY